MPANSQKDSNSLGVIPGPPSVILTKFIRDLRVLIAVGVMFIGLGVKGFISLIT